MRRMHTSLRVVVLALLLVPVAALTGCSAKGDLEKICNAEQLSGAANVADPSAKATKIAKWLQDNVRSTEGKNVFQALAMVSPADKSNVLREAAREVGYTGPCPMADAK